MKNTQSILELLLSQQNSNDSNIIKILESDISTIVTDKNQFFETVSKNDNLIPETFSATPNIKKNILDKDIYTFTKKVLDYTYLKLAFSKNITDTLDVFKHLTELLGKIDFLISIMFSVIYDNKLWIDYGYNSLDRFLDNLPSVYRISRQTFINIALAGKMIRYFGTNNNIEKKLGLELTPKLFFRNYSKIKLLYRIHYIWKLDITNEIMINFRDMTYRAFNHFVEEYRKRNNNLIKNKYYHRSFLAKQNKELRQFLYSRPFQINNLSGLDLEIYKEIRLGHIVEYINSSNSVFVNSIIKYLNDIYKKDSNNIYNDTFSASEIFYDGQLDTPLCNVDWAEYVPDNLKLTIENITAINLDLNPNELRETIIKKLKNKTEIILTQATLIYLIEHNTRIHSSICDYFIKYKIERQYTLEMDFAIIVLDLKLSRYKWLKRIGNSLPYLKRLKCTINFTGNLLEKLSYLKTAFDYHNENQALITDAFIILSAKRFRKFAYDKNDDLSNDLISIRDYHKAEPIINKVKTSKTTGSEITIISLQSNKQIKIINEINSIIQNRDTNLMKNYPDINWDSVFGDEIKRQALYESTHEEYKHLGIPGLFLAKRKLSDILGLNGVL